MLGTELKYEDFIEEYLEENNKGGSVEIIDLETDEVTEISEEDFKEMIKEENIET